MKNQKLEEEKKQNPNDVVLPQSSISFSKMKDAEILPEFKRLLNETKKIYETIELDENQLKMLLYKAESDLLDKLTEENADYLLKLDENVTKIRNVKVQNFENSFKNLQEEHKNALIPKLSDLIKELTENFSKQAQEEYKGMLPQILLDQHCRNIQVSLKKQFNLNIEKTPEEITGWITYCNESLEKISTSHMKTFECASLGITEENATKLLFDTTTVFSFSKICFSETDFYVWTYLLKDLIASLPLQKEEMTMLSEKISNLYQDNDKKLHAKIAFFACLKKLVCFLQKASLPQVKYFLFSVFLHFSGFYSGKYPFNYETYSPLLRDGMRKMIRKIKKGMQIWFPAETNTDLLRFLTFESYRQFESSIGLYLNLIKLPSPIISYGEVDILQEFNKEFETTKEESYVFHNKKTLEIIKSNKHFQIINMTPNRVSPHVYICILGYAQENDDPSKEWEQLIAYDKEDSFYVVKWASSEKGIWKLLRSCNYIGAAEQAKLTGILLAKALWNRFPFAHQAVSLISFSLGTQVVFSCIDELSELSRKTGNGCGHLIIHDVLFLAGAFIMPSNEIEIWQKKFDVVTGQILNCYALGDLVLRFILPRVYTGTAIGLHVLKTEKDQKKSVSFKVDKKARIKNYDLSEIVEGHTHYHENLVAVLQAIKFNE